MIDEIPVKIKKISPDFADVELPSYATSESAGMDVRAALKEDMIVRHGEIVLVPTNLSVEIPHGYEIQVRPRSGLAIKHGIGILNSPGTIDADYRGEIKIILFNFGKEDFKISCGDRIAQIILSKVYLAKIVQSENLSNSARGEGGFGHTGKE
ncbi:MAG: dUTP diphosphatase [Ignavibacteriaceae bacterium]